MKAKKSIKKLAYEPSPICYSTRLSTRQKNASYRCPQGAVLGPPLFIPCFNDMKTKLDNENELIQYAVDSLILAFDTSIDKSKSELQHNANKLYRYFHEYQLTVLAP